MIFKNLIEVYKKVLNEKANERSYIRYDSNEDSFIKFVYRVRHGDMDSLISTLKITSKQCKGMREYNKYNSERLFIELYNETKDVRP